MAKAIATIENRNGVLVTTFSDGTVVSLNPESLSAEMREQAMIHGLTQKIRDSFAGAKGDVNYAIAQAEAVVETLQGGSWNRRGGPAGSGGILAEAVARLKDISVTEAKEKLEGLDEDQLAALKKAKAVEAMMLQIKLERKQAQSKEGDDELEGLI